MNIINSLQQKLNTKEWILMDEELNYVNFSNVDPDKDYILYFGLCGFNLEMGILESGSADDLYQETINIKDKSLNEITQKFLENIKTGEAEIKL